MNLTKRRSALMYIYSVLVATEHRRIKSYFMLQVNMQWKLLNEILSMLIDKGLIIHTPIKRSGHGKGRLSTKGYYEITNDGRKAVETFEMLFDLFGFSQEVKEFISGFSDRPRTQHVIHKFWGTKELSEE